MTPDHISATVAVTLRYVVTCGFQDGRISRQALADLIAEQNEVGGIEQNIEGIEIIGLSSDDGEPLIEGAFSPHDRAGGG